MKNEAHMSFLECVPKYIQGIQPYKPGKPVEEVERELGIKAIKLASNENPLGPSQKAVAAMRRFIDHVDLYPDDTGYLLRQKIAERFNVSMDEVILGAGSSDILAMAFHAMLTPDSEILTSDGSFIIYYLLGQAKGCTMVRTPLRHFGYDLSAMAEHLNARTRIVLVANPNNPTGTIVRSREVTEFLKKVPESAMIILDEAYMEFVCDPEYPDSLQYHREGKNVLVLRTFSKAYGLAGLRIGYGIARPEIIDTLQKVRLSFNTGSIGQVAALAAFDDHAHVQSTVENNLRERVFLSGELSARGVKYVPTFANFIFMDLGEPAKDLDAAMLRQGVIVRPMAGWGFPTMIRVSIGTRPQNEKFLKALDAIR
jgi:histidinol-phosphate aminotransferase